MRIGKKIMLAASALVCLVLLIQGAISQVMIRNELKSVAYERLQDNVQDKKQSLVHLLHMTKQDMTAILANKAFEDYFSSRALEDDEGMLDSEFEIESFFKKIYKAKPQYITLQLTTASLEPVLMIDRGRRHERFHQHDNQKSKQLIAKLRADPEEFFSSSVQHSLFKDETGMWILQSTAAVRHNQTTEGIVLVCQLIESFIKQTFATSVNEGIYYTVSNEQGDFISHSPNAEPEILRGLAKEELADWLTASEQMPGLGLKVSLGIRKEKAFQIINKLSLLGAVVLVAALVLSLICLGVIARNISRPVKNLIAWTKRLSTGDLTVEDFQHRNDEIGELAREFKHMTEELSRTVVSKKYLDNIIESISNPFYVIDVNDYSIKLANSAADPTGKWKETTCYALTHRNAKPCGDKDHGCPMELVKKTGQPAVLEHLHYDKNGEQRYYDVHGYPVFNEKGEIVQMIESSIDITQHKNAEEQLNLFASKLKKSNEELEQFAYIASHDLQEPLRKVTVLGDRLKTKYAGLLGEQGLDYLSRMRNAAGRMQVLINDLLTFSRVTTKAQPLEPVHLSKVVRDVITDLEIRIEQVKGRVEVGDLPIVDADPLQMRQLVQNLIGNALKFHNKDKAPVVEVRGLLISRDGSSGGNDFCQLTVEDNGIGFDERFANRIFGTFQRLHGRNEYEGSGIGLSVCKKIVERHGGDIKAESNVGKGAKFIVTLPVKQISEQIS